MNTFGRIFRLNIFGESHGPKVGVLLDGCPAGLPLAAEDFVEDLTRRSGGVRGSTPRKEQDIPMLESGVKDGLTTGAPVLILFPNEDVRSQDYEALRHTPRPGHADFVAHHKFGGFADHRGGGHFSGRLTVGLVASGVIAKKLIAPVQVEAELIRAGGSREIESAIEAALSEGDSIGGVVECRAHQVPIGLGEPFFDSLESVIAHLAFSIPAIKGIEFGAGFGLASMRGSESNDQFADQSGQMLTGKTVTNHSGGVHGGLSNGNSIIFRVAVKPTSSISKPQQSFNLESGESALINVRGRHDACIALRVPVVLEAITAMALADFMMLEQRIPRVLDVFPIASQYDVPAIAAQCDRRR